MAYLDDIYAVLQVAPTGVPTYIRLSQNENGRRMILSVVGGEIPSGSTATISGTKPDGKVYSASCSISGSTVTVNETIQLTAAAGEWDAKIKIMNGGNTIATGRIRFVIDADTVKAGAVPSDSELDGLVAEAAQYAEDAKSAAYGSPLTAPTASAMIDKTRVYVYTGTESGYTNGDWYYWNGSAWVSGGKYNSSAVQTDKTLSIPDMAADAKATGDAIKKVDDDFLRSLIYEQTEPAGIASFSDGADGLPLKSLILNIEPHQDGSGDPSPDNVRSISGYTSVNVARAGKNLLPVFESQTKNGITLTANSDGTYTANGTATGVAEFATQPVKSRFYGGKILTGCPSGGGPTTYRISQQVQGSPWTFLTSDFGDGATLIETEYEYIRFLIRIENGQTVNNLVFKPMVRLASDIDATFEPYTGATYPITIPTSAGTVYGGELDVTTGLLTVDRSLVTLDGSNDESWGNENGNAGASGSKSFVLSNLSPGAAEHSESSIVNAISNYLKASSGNVVWSGADENIFNANRNFVGVRISGVSTKQGCLDYLAANPLVICYKLAQPLVIQLDANGIITLLGDNNIWMDADGTVEAIYPADTKLYIKKLAGSTEDDMVADANIVSGQYFMVGNTLYKATANIASGGVITPNVNCTRKSLPEVLNEINA